MGKYKKQKVEKLKEEHSKIKKRIKERIKEFNQIWIEGDDERIFKELVFCLFTPQSQAKSCWKAVQHLDQEDYLWNADEETLIQQIEGVRFKYKKAGYVVEAREKFIESDKSLKKTLKKINNEPETREYVVENIKGLGLKEGSHFLRNIGRSNNLAILDRHIMKNLNDINIIPNIPKTLTHKRYLQIEKEMQKFAEYINIPLNQLDLLLWYKEAGEVFK